VLLSLPLCSGALLVAWVFRLKAMSMTCFWSTLVALSGWSSDAQNYKFGIVRIDLCYTDWPLSKTIVIVLYDKLALSEGIFATLCNKISVVWDNLCYIMTYTIKLARLNLNINWANISTNSELCFDLRTCNSNKIEYVIALAEIKPKLLLWIRKTQSRLNIYKTCSSDRSLPFRELQP